MTLLMSNEPFLRRRWHSFLRRRNLSASEADQQWIAVSTGASCPHPSTHCWSTSPLSEADQNHWSLMLAAQQAQVWLTHEIQLLLIHSSLLLLLLPRQQQQHCVHQQSATDQYDKWLHIKPLKPGVIIWLNFECSAQYRPNLPFLISDIRALWCNPRPPYTKS